MESELNMAGGWHLDKRISVGHILTTLTVCIALFAWASKIENRVDRNEVRIDGHDQALLDLRTGNAVQYSEIIRRLERLDTNASLHLQQHAKDKQ